MSAIHLDSIRPGQFNRVYSLTIGGLVATIGTARQYQGKVSLRTASGEIVKEFTADEIEGFASHPGRSIAPLREIIRQAFPGEAVSFFQEYRL